MLGVHTGSHLASILLNHRARIHDIGTVGGHALFKERLPLTKVMIHALTRLLDTKWRGANKSELPVGDIKPSLDKQILRVTSTQWEGVFCTTVSLGSFLPPQISARRVRRI